MSECPRCGFPEPTEDSCMGCELIRLLTPAPPISLALRDFRAQVDALKDAPLSDIYARFPHLPREGKEMSLEILTNVLKAIGNANQSTRPIVFTVASDNPDDQERGLFTSFKFAGSPPNLANYVLMIAHHLLITETLIATLLIEVNDDSRAAMRSILEEIAARTFINGDSHDDDQDQDQDPRPSPEPEPDTPY
jgi:hypothetical protein